MKSKRSPKSRLAAGALAAGAIALSTLQAGAASIAITNASFESGTGPNPAGWTPVSPIRPGFAQVGGNYFYHTVPSPYPLPGTATGTNYLLLQYQSPGWNYNFTTATQTTSYVAQIGDVFTLKVAVGNNSNNSHDNLFSDYVPFVSLQIGGIDVVPTSALPSAGSILPYPETNAGTFDDIVFTYTATSTGLVGVTFKLDTSLTATPNQLEFDNVRLEVAAIPEPSTAASLFAGLLALFGIQRLRQRRLTLRSA